MADLKGQLFARLALDYFDHPKIAALSSDAVRAHLEMIVYSRRYLTDGRIPMRIAMRFASETLSELQSNDDANPSLGRIEGTDDYLLHDYADFQETREQVESRRRSRQKSAEARWSEDAKRNAPSNAKRTAPRNAETETETETVSTARRETYLPADWTPTPEHVAKARELRVDLNREAETFKAHAEANARKAVRWNAAFTQWLLKAKPSTTPPPLVALPGGRRLQDWELRG